MPACMLPESQVKLVQPELARVGPYTMMALVCNYDLISSDHIDAIIHGVLILLSASFREKQEPYQYVPSNQLSCI